MMGRWQNMSWRCWCQLQSQTYACAAYQRNSRFAVAMMSSLSTEYTYLTLYSSLSFYLQQFYLFIYIKYIKMAPNKPDLVSRDYTIHLAKRTHKTTFKSKTPKAVKEVKKFAVEMMKTKDVRLDPKVNKELWKQGVRNPPKRIRVRLSRKRNEDEDAEEKLYTLVQLVEVSSFKGLQTETVDSA